jgi:hypothetical protein
VLLHAHQVVFALNTALGAEGPLWVQSRLFDNVRAMSAIIPIAADAACRRPRALRCATIASMSLVYPVPHAQSGASAFPKVLLKAGERNLRRRRHGSGLKAGFYAVDACWNAQAISAENDRGPSARSERQRSEFYGSRLRCGQT